MLMFQMNPHAEVAKLVDVLALGASGVTHGGSSPLLGTMSLRVGREEALGALLREDSKPD